MRYTCIRCGKEFEAKRKTAVCKDCHIGICVVCGKEFKLQSPWTQKTCSKECRGQYVKDSGISKQRTNKAKQTLKSKYGVSNTQKLQEFDRVCKYCGKEFITTSPRKIYCDGPHYGKCPVCGKQTLVRDPSQGVKACSQECKQILIERTNIDRYGCKESVNSEHAREVAKTHNLEKYGVDHYSKTDEYKKKFKETCLQRFGTSTPLENTEIKAKMISTNNEKYGGNSPTCNSEVLNKIRETTLTNYGGFTFQNRELVERIKSTNLAKYGVENPMQNSDIRNKASETTFIKYGATNFMQSLSGYQFSNSDPSKALEYFQFVKNPQQYIESHYCGKVSISTLCVDLGVTDTPIYYHIRENNCQNLLKDKESSIEHEIIEYLKELDNSIIIKHNDRTVIAPQEIDIYLPQYQIGIECNPTVTHNSSLCDPWGGKPKPYKYHQNKSLAAKEKGIFIFHVFGYEWSHSKSVVLSMISNLIKYNSNKIYARNTYVTEISNSECIKFLNANHRQGKLSAKIRLGLKDKKTNELVSVMTFSHMRNTIGKLADQKGEVYELSRFCSKLNTSVVGGASKLFKYFLNNYPYDKIVSFSDLAHTRGSLYKILGFKEVSLSDPSYVWVNTIDDHALNRVNCQKRNLSSLFHENIDLSKTEKEIMEEHGYVRVFDSGVIRWEWSI